MAARPLFRTRSSAGLFGWYDVSPDGQRFVMTNREEEATNPATLVVHWPAELQSRQ